MDHDQNWRNLSANCDRAVTFLKLAVEQIRLYDDGFGEALHRAYVSCLESDLNVARNHVKSLTMSAAARPLATVLVQYAQQLAGGLTKDVPLAPPGMGRGVLPEAIPPRNTVSRSNLVFPQYVTKTEPHTNQMRTLKTVPYGVIGHGRQNGESSSAMISKLRDGSTPLGSLSPTSPWNQFSTGETFENQPLINSRVNAKQNYQPPVPTRYITPPTRPRSRVNPIQTQAGTSSFETNNPSSAPRTPASTTWASIAALSASTTKDENGHVKIPLQDTRTLPAVVSRVASCGKDTPKEPASEQNRVVWLAKLPEHYKIRDVSSRIKEGPVMSILLDNNVGGGDTDGGISGRSACIIFYQAEAANLFYAVARSKFVDVKDLVCIRGGPYPADEDIASMGSPINARRRLKWARKGLFYDVKLEDFKKDVVDIVGGHNIELFHFYNAGECTVVFSSVKVAAVCIARFLHMKRHRGSRYEGVEVAYARDFNEQESQPVKLTSVFRADGRMRCAFSAESAKEGLFSGPKVDGCDA